MIQLFKTKEAGLLLEILKKAFDKFDGVIILAAVFLFAHFDYENLTFIDKAYIGSFVLWALLKLVRIYILFQNERDNK